MSHEADEAERDVECVRHMVAAGELVMRIAKGGRAKFLSDIVTRSAIERQFEIFGEAARRVSDEFRAAHPEIPWRTIVALRNNLVHGYDAIVPEKLWDGISKALTPALDSLRALVK